MISHKNSNDNEKIWLNDLKISFTIQDLWKKWDISWIKRVTLNEIRTEEGIPQNTETYPNWA